MHTSLIEISKPILFSPIMVNAILKETKTQTRRICKYQNWSFSELYDFNVNEVHKKVDKNVSSPFQVDDILYVKEKYFAYGNWTKENDGYKFNDLTIDRGYKYLYDDCNPNKILNNNAKIEGITGWFKRNSLFMPKKAARIFLKVTDLFVEKLNSIIDEYAIKEGVEIVSYGGFGRSGEEWKNYYNQEILKTPTESFVSLWKSIYGEESWDENPFVWVILFKRIF